MTIPHGTPGGVKTPQDARQDASDERTAAATLRRAARDSQVTRTALAVLIELHTPSNEWRLFTVSGLASALVLSDVTIRRALALLAGKGRRKRGVRYLEERPTYGKHGEREARLVVSASGGTR